MTLGHGVWLTAEEIDIAAQRPTASRAQLS